MRIGFDGRALVSPAAGIRRYTRELFGAMAALDGVQVSAVGAPADAPLPPRVTRVPARRSPPTNAGWMLWGLPRSARGLGLDAFHAPSYTAPLGPPRPLVLTIHDVSYERHPEWYPYRRDPLRRAFYRWSARSADRIVTVSSFSKQEIVKAYGLREDAIDVIPNAVARTFVPGTVAAAREPYVLHVGDLHPRRNLETALRAVLRVRARRPALAGLRLVLAGVDRGSGGSLSAIAAEGNGGVGALELLGSIGDGELLELYRGAAALVYPSKYEGFGIPLVEAMACGTPVIGSRAASIPEVVGDAGMLVEPSDVSAWAEAIESVFDPSVAAARRAAGLRRAAAFTWERAAAETVATYRRALHTRR